jgi:hypothetical protein
MRIRPHRDKRTSRSFILPIIGRGDRERAKGDRERARGDRERARGDRDDEEPKGDSRDKTRSNGRH